MDQLKALFTKYLDDNCNTLEIKLLMQHFSELKNEAELKALIAAEMARDPMTRETIVKSPEAATEDALLEDRMLKIYDQLKPKLVPAVQEKSIVRPIHTYLKYAAAIVLVLSAMFYFYRNSDQRDQHQYLTAQHQGNDVNPGGNKAVLTLADGSEISLTDAGNGELASQSGITITKTRDGELVYETEKNNTTASKQYNTISTPAGGQYQINLPDGSKVWLNAMSSLKYPTSFDGRDRKVVLSGEAYFEIAGDASRPFVVSSSRAGREQEVIVLGTHFNIDSYADEAAIKTTLLEGRVKVATAGKARILKPGQQSAVSDQIMVSEVDVNQVLDWKNGNFYFYDENIRTVMRKLARWYDIDVVYQGKVPDYGFDAEISRTKKLSEILKGFETTGQIHFKIEGRRVTVMQ